MQLLFWCAFFFMSLIAFSKECMIRFAIIKYSFNILFRNMPKYAVAKGKNIGIYNTWAECQQQTKGYPNAKFRKFDLQKDAEDYIKGFTGVSVNASKPAPIIESISIENTAAHNAIPVTKVSPSNTTLHDFNNRLRAVESKLSNLIDHVTNAFSDIKQRLTALEGKSIVDNQLVQLEEQNKNITSNATRIGVKRKAENDIDEDEFSHSNNDLPEEKKTKLPKYKIIDDIDGNYGISRSHVNSEGFLVNPYGAVVVYTDGACSNNGKVGAKAGIGVWFNNEHPLNVAAPVKGRATNNNAEIQAATIAVLQASKAGIRKLHIFTDSKFLINCITAWIYKWKSNNWLTAEGKPVINKVELVELDDCINQHMDSVVWTYVKGHSNDIGNTSADVLARQGAKCYKKQ